MCGYEFVRVRGEGGVKDVQNWEVRIGGDSGVGLLINCGASLQKPSNQEGFQFYLSVSPQYSEKKQLNGRLALIF